MHRSQLTRRELLLGAMAAVPVLRSGVVADSIRGSIARRFRSVEDEFAAIERRVSGRLGVAALDTDTGKRVEYRAGERFAMCSTFKLLAVAAVLKRVDDGKDALNRRIAYSEKDLLDYAPIAKQHVGEGSMTVEALCAAAIEYSDNTAANLLLATLGGPAGVTHYARSLNDSLTRLDRTEPALNTALPGDERDTTTPGAMLADMQAILLGDALSSGSRQVLASWLVGNTTGAGKLRAGIPETWRVGDKTGSGGRGAMNDIAIFWRAERKPVLIAAYLNETSAPVEMRNAALRDVARVVAAEFR